MRRRRPPAPEEPPAWVRTFDPEQWRDDEADAPYLAGHVNEEARDWHAERRWCQAVNDWYRAHPAAERRWLEEFLVELRRDW